MNKIDVVDSIMSSIPGENGGITMILTRHQELGYIKMNRMGAIVLKLCDLGYGYNEIVNEMIEKYPNYSIQIEKDVENVLIKFWRLGIINLNSDALFLKKYEREDEVGRKIRIMGENEVIEIFENYLELSYINPYIEPEYEFSELVLAQKNYRRADIFFSLEYEGKQIGVLEMFYDAELGTIVIMSYKVIKTPIGENLDEYIHMCINYIISESSNINSDATVIINTIDKSQKFPFNTKYVGMLRKDLKQNDIYVFKAI